MTANGVLQLVLYNLVLVALCWPLGVLMAKVYQGERTWLSPVLGPLERIAYRVGGVGPAEEQDWKRYALAVLAFNFTGFVVVYLLQRLQGLLPLNPQEFGVVPASR
jgi:K+-transporting ATPase ATPase A chain